MTDLAALDRGKRLDHGLRAAYLRLIEHRFGLRLTDHQARNLPELATRLADQAALDGPRELFDQLGEDHGGALLSELAARLTIGETHFFRVEPQIEALRRTLLPELIARRSAEKRLRIWSAGCSTGEEPYTLAILLREWLPAAEDWDIRILATDINNTAIDTARLAVYGPWSFRGTSSQLRSRNFSPDGKAWRLHDSIRNMVQFAYVNLAGESLPLVVSSLAPLDLIVCRNVTIYFAADATQDLYERFGRLIAPSGWLVLGPSDPSPTRPSAFEPIPLPNAVVWRRVDESRRSQGSSTDPRPHQRIVKRTLSAQPESVRRPFTGVPSVLGATSEKASSTRAQDSAPAGDAPEAQTVAARTAPNTDLATAEALAQQAPLDAESHLRLGILHLDGAATVQAIEALRRAAFLSPHDPLIQFMLGRAYLTEGARARARAAFSHAQRLISEIDDEVVLDKTDGVRAGDLRKALDAELSNRIAPDTQDRAR